MTIWMLAIMFGIVLGGEDFYKLLKIERNADTAAIKKAFRKMSLEYHPDKNPGKFSLDKGVSIT